MRAAEDRFGRRTISAPGWLDTAQPHLRGYLYWALMLFVVVTKPALIKIYYSA
jgi:hypothetical protein